jgi:citrate lyase subunit beta/citryl-CoA lyase
MSMPAPRSYLFVPADRHERYAKAVASGADAVVVDLEDAVAEAAKVGARSLLAQWLPNLADAVHQRVVVRINAQDSPHFAEDVALLSAVGASAVMLPKAGDPRTLAQLQVQCPGIISLPLVESAQGMLAALTLASASGVQRLVFGTLDYALDLGLGSMAHALDAGHAHLSLVSRAAGLAGPVAGVTAAVDDEAELLRDWAQASSHGFTGKLCIHPRQIAPLHAAMAPTEVELAWARRVLQAAASSSDGAVLLDGRMVDKPVVERAHRLIERSTR